MQRRGLTVLVGTALVLVLVWGIWAAPVPYVSLGPGPTVDTLGQSNGKPVIEVAGASTTDSEGQLRLVTVSVASNLGLLDAIRGWFSDAEAVVPRELVYPPDQTQEEVDKQHAREFEASQSSAETVALRELGYPVQVTVTGVGDGAPAQGKLAVGDEITSVAGQPVTSGLKLQELVRAEPPGTALAIGYRRDGRAGTTRITTVRGEDGRPRIGIGVENKQPHPFTLKIDLEKIGGPSAGLMFALGIIDKLDPVDLTGGAVVAGTGTIDDEGRVGPIGGVPQKLVAAKGAGATIFLTPGDNCGEAVANAVPGLTLAKVTNLDDALAALSAARDGRKPAPCTAR
jgi:Lon-like protease